jgi:hypothetical protein
MPQGFGRLDGFEIFTLILPYELDDSTLKDQYSFIFLFFK